MIILLTKPPFRDDWTRVVLVGAAHEAVANILMASLGRADYDVMIQGPEGELTDLVDYEWPAEEEEA